MLSRPWIAALGSFVFAATLAAAAVPARPNIILFLADDLGYETIGANGGTSYRTPVLDQLAAQGARFTQCYVQPLCTPTRVQTMTGLYNVRNYINFGNMDAKSVTFGNLLKQAGYATCIAGKWQLGEDLALPKKFGFDEHCLWQHTRRPPRYANPGLEINGEARDFNRGEYGPDLISDYVLDFVARKKDTPFFVYYTSLLTHDPYQATPESPDWDPKQVGEAAGRHVRHFGEMVEYMDKLIGKLMARLDALGLRENTLILFVGDNGTGRGTPSRMGDRVVIGGKGTTTDAGMHVPLIAHWPKGIAAGRVYDDLVDSTDFLPTIVETAGAKLPEGIPFDGRSFLPQLRGEKGRPRDWVYAWYSPRQQADLTVREFAFNARYKLYRTGEFFDLTADLAEKSPQAVGALAGERAAAAKLLQGALDQYAKVRDPKLDELGLGAVEERRAGKAAKKKKA